MKGFTATDLFRAIGGQSLVTLSSADKPTAVVVLTGENDVLRIAGLVPGAESDFGPRIRSLVSSLLQNTSARIAVADVPRVGDLPFVASHAASKNLTRRKQAR